MGKYPVAAHRMLAIRLRINDTELIFIYEG